MGSAGTLFELMGIRQWSPPWTTTSSSDPQEEDEQLPRVQERQRRSSSGDERERTTGESEAPVSRRNPRWVMGGLKPANTDAEGDIDGKEERTKDGEPRLCVLDARTAVAALGNQLVGKGVETGLA